MPYTFKPRKTNLISMENKIVEDGLNKNKLERFEFFLPHTTDF